jgi:DinB family protein
MRALAPILAQLARSQDIYLAAATPIPESHWRRSPHQGAWSAAEVTAHVCMVEANIIDRASKGVQKPAEIVPFWRRGHIPLPIVSWRVIKRKSPIPLEPTLVLEKRPALETLAMKRRLTMEFVEATRDRDLSDYRFRHPFLGSLGLYDWLRMIAFHEVRHAKQIREIVQVFRQT